MKEQIEQRTIEQMEAARKMKRFDLWILFWDAGNRLTRSARLSSPRAVGE